MALTATATKAIGLAPGVKLFMGTLTATAGNSGNIVVATVQPLLTQYWTKTANGEFSPVTLTQTYTANTTTGRTTFTITVDETITDGKYTILALV